MSEADPLAAYMSKAQPAAADPKAVKPDGAGDDPLASYMQRAARPGKPPGGGSGDSALGAAQAFTEHAGNQMTMGYLPHIQAALNPDIEKTLDLVTGQDVTGTPKLAKIVAALKLTQPDQVVGQLLKQAFMPDQGYVASRDENIKRLDRERKDYPISSVSGDVAGIVGGAVLTSGAGAARAAVPAGFGARSLLAAKNIGQASMRGAVQAGLWNPGDTEGQAGGLQLDQRLANARTGAEIGGAVQGAFEAAPLVKGAIKYAGAKILSTTTGIAEDSIGTYMNRTDKINKMIKDSGGQVTEMTDQARERLQNGLRTYRQGLGKQIGDTLAAAPTKASLPMQPVIDALEDAKGRMNTIFDEGKIAQVDQMIAKVRQASAPDGYGKLAGMTNAFWMNETKEYLQGLAKSSYMKDGAIFMNAPEVAQAAKAGAAIARKSLNEAVPEVAAANNQLAALHIIEDKLNKNLITPGSPDGALLAAGSGQNPRNAKMLEKLGNITGIPALQSAKDLAAARSFAHPPLLPTDSTGKATTRMALSIGAGHFLGPAAGFAVGSVVSPMGAKLAINAGNALNKAAGGLSVSPGAQSGIGYAAQAIGSNVRAGGLAPPPKDASDDPQLQSFFKKNPEMLDHVQDKALRKSISDKITPKGEDLWASNGAKALGLQGDQADQLSSTREGKNLLIQASNLKPGSKAMKELQAKIQTQLKGAK